MVRARIFEGFGTSTVELGSRRIQHRDIEGSEIVKTEKELDFESEINATGNNRLP